MTSKLQGSHITGLNNFINLDYFFEISPKIDQNSLSRVEIMKISDVKRALNHLVSLGNKSDTIFGSAIELFKKIIEYNIEVSEKNSEALKIANETYS